MTDPRTLSDLRAELDRRTHAVDGGPPATGRLAGIRTRYVRRRRQRAGAAIGAGVLAIGAVVAVPLVAGTNGSTAPDAPVATPGPPEGPTYAFPEVSDNDDTLIGSAVGVPGQARVEVAFTPTTRRLSLAALCDWPGLTALRPRMMVYLTVEGRQGGLGTSCADGDTASDPTIGPTVLGGVVPGKQATIVVTVQGPRSVPDDLVLGAGVFEPGARTQVGGSRLADVETIEGRRFELTDLVASGDLVDGDRRITVDVPASDEAGYLVYGSSGPLSGVFQRLRVGLSDRPTPIRFEPVQNGVLTGAVLPDGRARTVTLTTPAAIDRGRPVLAYYAPAG